MSEQSYIQAIRDFRYARREAAVKQLLARITGKPNDLLAYNEISNKLHATDTIEHGLQEIPIDSIVGSVGRAKDFTRDFLPKRDSDGERWARVKAAVLDMKGWPPIEVYQIDEVYFVKDGNHRVSVARQLGTSTISAIVTEIQTNMPLSPEDKPTEIICKANYADFLARTQLDGYRPDANIYLTFCNQYQTLFAQVKSYQQILTEAQGRPATDAEAVVGWYDNVYMPVILLIREQGILHNFPERTEADLYVLLSERREEIETALGWQIDAKTAVVNLAPAFDRAPQNMLSRLGGRLMEVVAPGLEDGPPVGFWREQREALHRADVLFDDILVSLQGTEADWHLLDGVIEVAKRENGRLLAINAVASEAELSDPRVEEIEAGFQQRCQASGVQGEFAAEVGVEGEIMIRRAAWVDLVATNLTFATELKPRLPLSSGVDMLIQQCPRPILVLPGVFESPMDRALLGYDGSPKAREALYVAAYLASCWQLHLDVVTVETDFTSSAALDEARQYLTSCGVENVNYLMRSHPIADALLETAVSRESNLLIVGGFGFRPVRYMMVGSTVDRALREFKQPILICR